MKRLNKYLVAIGLKRDPDEVRDEEVAKEQMDEALRQNRISGLSLARRARKDVSRTLSATRVAEEAMEIVARVSADAGRSDTPEKR